MYDDFVYTPTNGLLGAYWGRNYAIIYQCNDILTAIAEKETAGQTEAEDIINKGEASFFRAYCYFNLVRAFGEVPFGDLQNQRRFGSQHSENHRR